MINKINFYKNKVAINCLAKDINNAKAIHDAVDGHIAVGILSKNFDNIESCIEEVNKYKEKVAVSIGLGSGDPDMWERVANIASKTNPAHINQVFTGAPVTKGMLKINKYDGIVNSLISPTGNIGMVKISTGSLSSKGKDAIVNTESAILMLKDMQVDAVKFFPMGGLKSIDELKEVAKFCQKYNIMLEPTGGITIENFEEILTVCIDLGVKRIMPHIYNSIIDKNGNTNVEKVKILYDIIKKVV